MTGRFARGCCLLLALQAPTAPPDAAPRVEAINRETLAASTATPPDSAAARTALRAVLSQRAFSQTRSESWQDDLRRRFSQWLSDLWNRTFGQQLGRGTIPTVLAWVTAAAAVLVLLVWIGQTMARRRAEPRVAISAIPTRRATAGALAIEAAALVRAGRTRDAARVAYRAAVHRLETEGTFRVDETRTPREYLRLLPVPHRRRAALSALIALFEGLWYGSRAASADEGRAIVTLLQDLECLPADRAN